MTSNENESSSILGRRQRTPEYALQVGPRKKAYVHHPLKFWILKSVANSTIADPLVHHGRHFGRTIHAFCQVQALLNNGIVREMDMLDTNEARFPISLE